MYNIVFWCLERRKLERRNYYLPLTLFIINFSSLFYFGIENGKDEFTYEVVENVMSYLNYIVILFVFPISTAFFSYQCFKLLKVYPSTNLFRSNPQKFYLSLFVILYILYISIWVLQNYVLNEGLLKSLLKSYYILYFVASYFSIYKVYNCYYNRKGVDDKIRKFDSIEEKITLAMKESKIFLNSRLTVKQLAKELGSNEKYVSNIINQRYQMNFSNFVNDFRIKYAAEILLDDNYKNFTIEAIGGLSGFSSKSAFNATFKKINGMTPSEYKIINTK
jgi:AraC-like DNA-binding protein